MVDFAIYPNERESFQKILDWTYAAVSAIHEGRLVVDASTGRLPSLV